MAANCSLINELALKRRVGRLGVVSGVVQECVVVGGATVLSIDLRRLYNPKVQVAMVELSSMLENELRRVGRRGKS